MRRWRSRRGGNAIEFALTAPVIAVLLAGIVDYGWLFYQQIALQNATRDSVRAGSVAPPELDPTVLAEEESKAVLTKAGIDPLTVNVVVTYEDAWPDERVRVSMDMKFESLIGLVPVPEVLDTTMAMRLEHQEEPMP